jgi:hypothetical protein
MITGTSKLVQLTPVNPVLRDEFDITTVAGRDAIADQILKDIDEYCAVAYNDGPRSHLGISVVGNACERYIWFQFRWMHFEQFSGRMQRLFNRGHKEEERIIEWLTAIGFEVKQTDVDGKQIRVAGINKHYGGSCDGQSNLPLRYGVSAYYPDLLLEFKTANERLFKEVKNSGVKKAKPQHWIQTCCYGKKLELRYVLYICVGKNDDDLDIELLELDWSLADAVEAKAEKIIYSQTPPPRLPGAQPSYYECKWCCMNEICWNPTASIEKNCRSCRFAQPAPEAQWGCNQWNALIPSDVIPKGCDAWKPLPR